MKKIFLLVMLLASVFFTGCKKGPDFTVKDGQIKCKKIMAKNAKILSPGAPYRYKLTYISFKDNYGKERGYKVQFDSELRDGIAYHRQCIFVFQNEWFSVIAKPLIPSEWFIKQNKKNALATLFGAEIKLEYTQIARCFPSRKSNKLMIFIPSQSSE